MITARARRLPATAARGGWWADSASSHVDPGTNRRMEMRVTRLLAVTALALGGLMTASQASAQAYRPATGFYAGGSVGGTSFESDIARGLLTSGRVDTSDTGFKLFGGYELNRNFALEVAYVDLGKASYSGFAGPDPVTGGKVEVTGLNLSAVGSWPLAGNVDVFGKIGFFSWEDKASDVTAGSPFSDKIDGTDLTYGFGASFHITRNVSARVEWERFRVDETNADLFSVGALIRF
jgi:OOP family OmpA-OmpF porin